jgi:SAM-dependent methyltransferase
MIRGLRKYGVIGSAKIVWRLLMTERPEFYRQAQALVAEKSGCEIGGTSFDFTDRGAIPLYRFAARIDNFQYSAKTLRAEFQDGESYIFHSRRAQGTTFLREASDLQVPDSSYEFVLSSHVLEHCANPIRVLQEWQRVVHPGAPMILSLPYHRWQFDHRRQPTSIEHMLEDYANAVGEDDLTHLPEIRQLHDHPTSREAGTVEQYWQWASQNSTYRVLHHHVFDSTNVRQLLEAAGLKVVAVEYVRPHHVMSLSLCANVGAHA